MHVSTELFHQIYRRLLITLCISPVAHRIWSDWNIFSLDITDVIMPPLRIDVG